MKKYKIYNKEFDAMIASNYRGPYTKEDILKHRTLANVGYTIIFIDDISKCPEAKSCTVRELIEGDSEIDNPILEDLD